MPFNIESLENAAYSNQQAVVQTNNLYNADVYIVHIYELHTHSKMCKTRWREKNS